MANDGEQKPPSGTPLPEEVLEQFNDIFADFFGGRRGQPAPHGTDLSQPLTITASEAREGCERQVTVTRRTVCAACSGSGARDGRSLRCTDCQGHGRMLSTQGAFQIQRFCPTCRGAGRLAETACGECVMGLRATSDTLTVKVPASTEEGIRLRCQGKGDEAPGGPPGDLYLVITVQPDVLVRRGDDVMVEAVLEPAHLVRGGRIEVPALEGRVTVEVPRGVGEGDTVTLPGRGHLRASAAPVGSGDPYREVARGDQVVVFRVAEARSRLRGQVFWLAVGLTATAAILWAALVLGR